MSNLEQFSINDTFEEWVKKLNSMVDYTNGVVIGEGADEIPNNTIVDKKIEISEQETLNVIQETVKNVNNTNIAMILALS